MSVVSPSYGQTQKSAFVALVREYSDGRKDEREIEVTSVARLGSRFLLRNSRIKLHPQQWNRMNRATRATRFLTSNLISRAELSNSDVEASSISLERLPHGDACRGWER